MTLFEAVILGIIQGLTEFIPISSSAHLIIVPWVFHWPDPGLSFDVALHLGTLLALLAFFWSDWVRLIRAGVLSIIERKIGNDVNRRLFWFLVIGTIPGGIAGWLGEGAIENLFHKRNIPPSMWAMITMAFITALLGLALYTAERITKRERGLENTTLKDAIIVGVSQALSIFPGVSRSGSTITAGLFVGLKREAAVRFSFLLSTPIILGAGLKSAFDIKSELAGSAIAHSEKVFFAAGFIAAAVSGYLCIKYLLRFLRSHSTDVFVYYRWALAIFIIVLAVARA